MTWIKTSERLPEIGQDVLGFVPSYGELNILYLKEGVQASLWWWDYLDRRYTVDLITHWQPLPPPPEPEPELIPYETNS